MMKTKATGTQRKKNRNSTAEPHRNGQQETTRQCGSFAAVPFCLCAGYCSCVMVSCHTLFVYIEVCMYL